MPKRIANPFNIVKANDFTDQQIFDYWVDISEGKGFEEIISPLSTMPMIIFGGKGSGKTHIMRYFSYPIQKIRYKENYIKGIKEDGFIGIYIKCGGLNSKRFSGKICTPNQWSLIFSYYFDIWLSQFILETAIDIINNSGIEVNNEDTICEEIISLFDDNPFENPEKLGGLLYELNDLQHKIDNEVNNCIFSEKIDIKIKSSPGKLIYGIPKILEKNIPFFSDLLFVFLIDELENFLEEQQIYINTLIRDREFPCTIKVGVRSYGIKTFKTLADGEENRAGSEFDFVKIDSQLRKKRKENYHDFAINLCVKRLKESKFKKFLDGNTLTQFHDSFETPIAINELDDIDGLSSGRKGKSIKRLESQLKEHKGILKNRGIDGDGDIEEILNLLSFKGKPLFEKSGTYLFYKKWKTNKNLKEAALTIATLYQDYINDRNSNKPFKELISKFKYDLLAQLRKDNSQKQVYAGVGVLVEISKGLPRSLLTMFKHIYQFSIFNGEKPFVEDKISIKSQLEGVRQSSEWYFEDSRMAGKEGSQLKASMERLAELYRINRYSDKPSECSLRAFSANISKTTQTTQKYLDLAGKWSLLIKDSKGRFDKNSERIDETYVLNPMLVPHWGLPIGVRGIISFNSKILDAIFDPEYENTFDDLKKEFETNHNAPFKKLIKDKPKKLIKDNQMTLFDEF